MGMFFNVVFTLLSIIGAIVVIIVICVTLTIVKSNRFMDRILRDLPWMVWVSFADILERGYSKSFAAATLPLLHKRGNLEVRLSEDLPEEITADQLEHIKKAGYTFLTVEYYDVRLTKRGGWRKRKESRDPAPVGAPSGEPLAAR